MSEPKPARRIVQIASYKMGTLSFLYALCDDGTMWGREESGSILNSVWISVATSATSAVTEPSE